MTIDFVIMWVDGNDSSWQEKKRKYDENANSRIDNSIVRYRDWDNLHLLFRSIDKFAPWVNHIYLITDNQRPEWLNIKHDKLTIVDHRDYIPLNYLPTFNSHTIELNIHRIKGLSEHFVIFNDDTFLISSTRPEDFFKNGKPCDTPGLNAITGYASDIIYAITANNVAVINEHFDKKETISNNKKSWYSMNNFEYTFRTLLLSPWKLFPGFNESHLPNSYAKSTFMEVWEKEHDLLHNTSSHKFRDQRDVNQWLMKNWQLASNNFHSRDSNFGKFFNLNAHNLDLCLDHIKNKKTKVVCINDNESLINFEETKNQINNALTAVLGEKCQYEK